MNTDLDPQLLLQHIEQLVSEYLIDLMLFKTQHSMQCLQIPPSTLFDKVREERWRAILLHYFILQSVTSEWIVKVHLSQFNEQLKWFG